MKKAINSYKNLFCIVFLLLIISFSLYFILHNSSFTPTDDALLLMPHFFGDRYIALFDRAKLDSDARFLPLQFFDFNILFVLGISPKYIEISAFIYLAIKFVLLIFFLLYLFKNISIITKRKFDLLKAVLCISGIYISSDIAQLFSMLCYMELTICLFLVVFLFFMLKGYQTDKKKYFLISFLFGFYTTYMKETVFLIPLTIAMTNLLFNKKLSKNAKIFNYSLILNCVIFLTLYYFIAFINRTNIYSPISMFSIDRIKGVLSNAKYLYLIFFISFYRLYKVFIEKDRNNILFDGVLFSSCVYSLSFLILGIEWSFYHVVSLVLFLIWVYSISYNYIWFGNILIAFCLILYFDIKRINFFYYYFDNFRKNAATSVKMLENKKIAFLLPKNATAKNFNWWHLKVIEKYYFWRKVGSNYGNLSIDKLQKLINENLIDYIFVYSSDLVNFADVQNFVYRNKLEKKGDYWEFNCYKVIR